MCLTIKLVMIPSSLKRRKRKVQLDCFDPFFIICLDEKERNALVASKKKKKRKKNSREKVPSPSRT